jgi:hypothetical protein
MIMPRPRTGSKLTLSQLEQMLADRHSQISELRDQKAQLQKQMGSLDRQIRKIGGHGTGRPGRLGRPPKMGRPPKLGRPVGSGRGGRRGPRVKNKVSLADAVEQVLAGGSAKSVGDIAAAVLATGYKTKSAQFRNIVNQALIKEKRFVSSARGMYQLKK